MMSNVKTYESELRRVKYGSMEDEIIPGVGTVCFIATCNGDAERVLNMAKAAMSIVSQKCVLGWSDDLEEWHRTLPATFIKACARERSDVEVELSVQRWRELSDAERKAEMQEERWALSEWLYWLDPNERTWLWWDAEILDQNMLAIAVAVESWPFPWGALQWLFKASGAVSVESE